MDHRSSSYRHGGGGDSRGGNNGGDSRRNNGDRKKDASSPADRLSRHPDIIRQQNEEAKFRPLVVDLYKPPSDEQMNAIINARSLLPVDELVTLHKFDNATLAGHHNKERYEAYIGLIQEQGRGDTKQYSYQWVLDNSPSVNNDLNQSHLAMMDRHRDEVRQLNGLHEREVNV